MTELGSKLSNWIWINTPDSGIYRPNLYRPNFPIGEQPLQPILDCIERFMGTKDILFQIRDHLFLRADKLIKNTRSIKNFNLKTQIFISKAYVQANIWRLPNLKNPNHSNEDTGYTEDEYGKYILDEALVGGWLRQQFASWALAYHREISPLINISIEVVDDIRQGKSDENDSINKYFRIAGPKYENFDPRARFQFIVPLVEKDLFLKAEDFEKSYCDFGLKTITEKLDIDYSSRLPLVSDNHIRVFWNLQPWLMHTGEHETWLLSGGDETLVSNQYGGWRMLPDNAFVPLSIKNIVLMGRVTKHHDGIQPVRGSLLLRYWGEK